MMPGWSEWAIIALIVVLVFGARKLPELGRSVGEGIKEFKKASKGILDEDEKKDE